MKNIVLIDFTPESIDALNYAIGFTKAMKGELELLNVSDTENRDESKEKLIALKDEYSSDSLEINVVKLIGNMENELPNYINSDKVGFVFSGTHELKVMEQFFSSRTLNLLNKARANFIFIPHRLNKYQPIKKVLLPVFEDTQSLQNISELRFLQQFMKFDIVLGTFKTEDNVVKNNLIMASKLLNTAGIDFTFETMSDSERTFKSQLSDFAKIGKADLISIVNLTEESFFNSKEKSFVEDIIRNRENVPVLVIQHENTTIFGGFRAMGG